MYFSPHIVRMVKCRRMRLHLHERGEKFSYDIVKEPNVGVDGRFIIKWDLKE